MSSSGRLTSFGVALEAEHDFRCAVPACRDVLGHVPCIFLGVDREAACESEIADLELTVGVDKKVSGLEITVKNVGRVHVLEPTKDLINEGLEVSVGQGLTRPDDSRQVALHQLCERVVSADSPLRKKVPETGRWDGIHLRKGRSR